MVPVTTGATGVLVVKVARVRKAWAAAVVLDAEAGGEISEGK